MTKQEKIKVCALAAIIFVGAVIIVIGGYAIIGAAIVKGIEFCTGSTFGTVGTIIGILIVAKLISPKKKIKRS